MTEQQPEPAVPQEAQAEKVPAQPPQEQAPRPWGQSPDGSAVQQPVAAPGYAPPPAGPQSRVARVLRGSAVPVLAAGLIGGLVGGGVMAGAVALFDGSDRQATVTREVGSRGPGQGGFQDDDQDQRGFPGGQGQDGFPGAPGQGEDGSRQWPGRQGQQDSQEQPRQPDAGPSASPSQGA